MLAGFYGRGIYNANSRKKQYSSELKMNAQSERHQRNSKQLFDRLKNSLKAITDVVSEVRLMYKENEEDNNIKQNIVRDATSLSPSTNEAKHINANTKNNEKQTIKKIRSKVSKGAGDKLLNAVDNKNTDNDKMKVDDDGDVAKALNDYDSIVDDFDDDDDGDDKIADVVDKKNGKGDEDGDEYNGDFEEFNGEKPSNNDDNDHDDDNNGDDQDANDGNRDDNIDEYVKYDNDDDPNDFEPLTITPSNDDADERDYRSMIYDNHDHNDANDDQLLDNKDMSNEKEDERIARKGDDDKYDDEDFDFDGEMLTPAFICTAL